MKKSKKRNSELPLINTGPISVLNMEVFRLFKKSMFKIEVSIGDNRMVTAIVTLPSRIEGEAFGEKFKGTGSSKKEAKTKAANAALVFLQETFSNNEITK